MCELLSQGVSVNALCKMKDMPEKSTFYAWLMRYPDFLEAYDIAKEKQMDFYANEILEITDDCPADSDAVAKAKLQVNTRQWLMGKLKAKKYGERTTISGDKDNPLTLNLAAVLDQRLALRQAHETLEHVPAPSSPLPVLDGEVIESSES